MLCFLRNSTEFLDMRTECQIIIMLFLFPIYHKYIAYSKSTSLFSIALQYLLIFYYSDVLHKEEVMIYINRIWVT